MIQTILYFCKINILLRYFFLAIRSMITFVFILIWFIPLNWNTASDQVNTTPVFFELFQILVLLKVLKNSIPLFINFDLFLFICSCWIHTQSPIYSIVKLRLALKIINFSRNPLSENGQPPLYRETQTLHFYFYSHGGKRKCSLNWVRRT